MKALSFKRQIEILEECVNQDIPLSSELEKQNLSYDDLRYRTQKKYVSNGEKVQLLDDIEMPGSFDIPAVSFFAGAGGLDIGFSYAGFDNIAAVEHTELFCDTLRRNDPSKIVMGPPNFLGDISNVDAIIENLKKNVGLPVNFEGVFHGGPPCQSFSVAANQRFGKKDKRFKRLGFDDPKRGGLFFDYIKIIEYFKPKAFMIENVAGIQDFDTDNQIKLALENLGTLGYSIINPTVVNAADFGVPQNRLRWIVFGIKNKGPLEFPKPDKIKYVSSYEALRRPLRGISNHITRNHSAASIMRYMELGFGERDKLGRVDRLDPSLPSKTIIAGGTKGGGRSHLHPFIPRTLSVRESARLQSFPDWYTFAGSNARQFTQVGNAVPPLLAYKIAKIIKKQM